jgi:hypothetical protein
VRQAGGSSRALAQTLCTLLAQQQRHRRQLVVKRWLSACVLRVLAPDTLLATIQLSLLTGRGHAREGRRVGTAAGPCRTAARLHSCVCCTSIAANRVASCLSCPKQLPLPGVSSLTRLSTHSRF